MKTRAKEHWIDIGIHESELEVLVRLATRKDRAMDRAKLKEMLAEIRGSLDLDAPKKIRKILEVL